MTRAGLSGEEREAGFAIVNGWLVETSTECDCSGGVYGHMPECGLSPIGKVDDLLRDAARTADLAAQVARVEALADDVPTDSPHIDHANGEGCLECARCWADAIRAALSPAHPDTATTPFVWPAGDPFPAQPDTGRGA